MEDVADAQSTFTVHMNQTGSHGMFSTVASHKLVAGISSVFQNRSSIRHTAIGGLRGLDRGMKDLTHQSMQGSADDQLITKNIFELATTILNLKPSKLYQINVNSSPTSSRTQP